MPRTGGGGGPRFWLSPSRKPVFATDMFSRGRMRLDITINLSIRRVKQHGIHRRLMFPDSQHVMSATACKL